MALARSHRDLVATPVRMNEPCLEHSHSEPKTFLLSCLFDDSVFLRIYGTCQPQTRGTHLVLRLKQARFSCEIPQNQCRFDVAEMDERKKPQTMVWIAAPYGARHGSEAASVKERSRR